MENGKKVPCGTTERVTCGLYDTYVVTLADMALFGFDTWKVTWHLDQLEFDMESKVDQCRISTWKPPLVYGLNYWTKKTFRVDNI